MESTSKTEQMAQMVLNAMTDALAQMFSRGEMDLMELRAVAAQTDQSVSELISQTMSGAAHQWDSKPQMVLAGAC